MARLRIHAVLEKENSKEVDHTEDFIEILKLIRDNDVYTANFISKYNNWSSNFHTSLENLNATKESVIKSIRPSYFMRFLATTFVTLCLLESVRCKNSFFVDTALIFCIALFAMNFVSYFFLFFAASPNQLVSSMILYTSNMKTMFNKFNLRLNRCGRKFEFLPRSSALFIASNFITSLPISHLILACLSNLNEWYLIHGSLFSAYISIIFYVLDYKTLPEIEYIVCVLLFLLSLLQDRKVQNAVAKIKMPLIFLESECVAFRLWFEEKCYLKQLLEASGLYNTEILKLFNRETEENSYVLKDPLLCFVTFFVAAESCLPPNLNFSKLRNIISFILYGKCNPNMISCLNATSLPNKSPISESENLKTDSTDSSNMQHQEEAFFEAKDVMEFLSTQVLQDTHQKLNKGDDNEIALKIVPESFRILLPGDFSRSVENSLSCNSGNDIFNNATAIHEFKMRNENSMNQEDEIFTNGIQSPISDVTLLLKDEFGCKIRRSSEDNTFSLTLSSKESEGIKCKRQSCEKLSSEPYSNLDSGFLFRKKESPDDDFILTPKADGISPSTNVDMKYIPECAAISFQSNKLKTDEVLTEEQSFQPITKEILCKEPPTPNSDFIQSEDLSVGLRRFQTLQKEDEVGIKNDSTEESKLEVPFASNCNMQYKSSSQTENTSGNAPTSLQSLQAKDQLQTLVGSQQSENNIKNSASVNAEKELLTKEHESQFDIVSREVLHESTITDETVHNLEVQEFKHNEYLQNGETSESEIQKLPTSQQSENDIKNSDAVNEGNQLVTKELGNQLNIVREVLHESISTITDEAVHSLEVQDFKHNEYLQNDETSESEIQKLAISQESENDIKNSDAVNKGNQLITEELGNQLNIVREVLHELINTITDEAVHSLEVQEFKHNEYLQNGETSESEIQKLSTSQQSENDIKNSDAVKEGNQLVTEELGNQLNIVREVLHESISTITDEAVHSLEFQEFKHNEYLQNDETSESEIQKLQTSQQSENDIKNSDAVNEGNQLVTEELGNQFDIVREGVLHESMSTITDEAVHSLELQEFKHNEYLQSGETSESEIQKLPTSQQSESDIKDSDAVNEEKWLFTEELKNQFDIINEVLESIRAITGEVLRNIKAQEIKHDEYLQNAETSEFEIQKLSASQRSENDKRNSDAVNSGKELLTEEHGNHFDVENGALHESVSVIADETSHNLKVEELKHDEYLQKDKTSELERLNPASAQCDIKTVSQIEYEKLVDNKYNLDQFNQDNIDTQGSNLQEVQNYTGKDDGQTADVAAISTHIDISKQGLVCDAVEKADDKEIINFNSNIDDVDFNDKQIMCNTEMKTKTSTRGQGQNSTLDTQAYNTTDPKIIFDSESEEKKAFGDEATMSFASGTEVDMLSKERISDVGRITTISSNIQKVHVGDQEIMDAPMSGEKNQSSDDYENDDAVESKFQAVTSANKAELTDKFKLPSKKKASDIDLSKLTQNRQIQPSKAKLVQNYVDENHSSFPQMEDLLKAMPSVSLEGKNSLKPVIPSDTQACIHVSDKCNDNLFSNLSNKYETDISREIQNVVQSFFAKLHTPSKDTVDDLQLIRGPFFFGQEVNDGKVDEFLKCNQKGITSVNSVIYTNNKNNVDECEHEISSEKENNRIANVSNQTVNQYSSHIEKAVKQKVSKRRPNFKTKRNYEGSPKSKYDENSNFGERRIGVINSLPIKLGSQTFSERFPISNSQEEKCDHLLPREYNSTCHDTSKELDNRSQIPECMGTFEFNKIKLQDKDKKMVTEKQATFGGSLPKSSPRKRCRDHYNSMTEDDEQSIDRANRISLMKERRLEKTLTLIRNILHASKTKQFTLFERRISNAFISPPKKHDTFNDRVMEWRIYRRESSEFSQNENCNVLLSKNVDQKLSENIEDVPFIVKDTDSVKKTCIVKFNTGNRKLREQQPEYHLRKPNKEHHSIENKIDQQEPSKNDTAPYVQQCSLNINSSVDAEKSKLISIPVMKDKESMANRMPFVGNIECVSNSKGQEFTPKGRRMHTVRRTHKDKKLAKTEKVSENLDNPATSFLAETVSKRQLDRSSASFTSEQRTSSSSSMPPGSSEDENFHFHKSTSVTSETSEAISADIRNKEYAGAIYESFTDDSHDVSIFRTPGTDQQDYDLISGHHGFANWEQSACMTESDTQISSPENALNYASRDPVLYATSEITPSPQYANRTHATESENKLECETKTHHMTWTSKLCDKLESNTSDGSYSGSNEMTPFQRRQYFPNNEEALQYHLQHNGISLEFLDESCQVTLRLMSENDSESDARQLKAINSRENPPKNLRFDSTENIGEIAINKNKLTCQETSVIDERCLPFKINAKGVALCAEVVGEVQPKISHSPSSIDSSSSCYTISDTTNQVNRMCNSKRENISHDKKIISKCTKKEHRKVKNSKAQAKYQVKENIPISVESDALLSSQSEQMISIDPLENFAGNKIKDQPNTVHENNFSGNDNLPTTDGTHESKTKFETCANKNELNSNTSEYFSELKNIKIADPDPNTTYVSLHSVKGIHPFLLSDTPGVSHPRTSSENQLNPDISSVVENGRRPFKLRQQKVTSNAQEEEICLNETIHDVMQDMLQEVTNIIAEVPQQEIGKKEQGEQHEFLPLAVNNVEYDHSFHEENAASKTGILNISQEDVAKHSLEEIREAYTSTTPRRMSQNSHCSIGGNSTYAVASANSERSSVSTHWVSSSSELNNGDLYLESDKLKFNFTPKPDSGTLEVKYRRAPGVTRLTFKSRKEKLFLKIKDPRLP